MLKYVLSLCILLFIGCATYKEQRQLDSLEEASNAYEMAIRWSRYKVANGFMKMQEINQQNLDFKKLKKIKVTSYELLDRKISKDRLLAQQIVEIKYYNLDYMVEKTLIDKQSWEYDVGEKTWYLQSGFPDFK